MSDAPTRGTDHRPDCTCVICEGKRRIAQETCEHVWYYVQRLPDHPYPSAPQQRDNGNTNCRICRSCKLEQRKVWQ